MRLLFDYLPGMDITAMGGTFTRATTATYVDRNGVLQTAAAGAIRDAHYIDGERHTLLEKLSQNLLVQSENFGVSWGAVNTPTRTAAAHTASGVSLDLLGDDSATVTDGYTQSVFFTGDAVKAISLYVKQGTSSSSVIQLSDNTAAASRLIASIAWSSGVPVVVAAAGTYLGYEALAGGVYRLLFLTASVTAANSHAVNFYPANSVAGDVSLTGDVYAGGVQAENSPYPTSYIPTTTAAVTRNADELYFSFAHLPQEMTTYAQINYRGDLSDNPRVYNVGGAANPKLALLGNTSSYRAHHHNGMVAADAFAPVAPSFGNTVELRQVLEAATGITHIGQSIGGGAEATETSGDPAGSIASAWSAVRVYVAGDGGAAQGSLALQSLRIMAGTQTMATMREPLAYIRFEDDTGLAYLSNEKPFPANRFQTWNSDPAPFGDSANTLATGALVMLRLRDDFAASFELPMIPSVETNTVVPTQLAARLMYHLRNGGTCMVVTGDAEPTVYSVCGIKPGTSPQLALTDRRTMEYTLSLALLNLATSPDHMHAPRYANQ